MHGPREMWHLDVIDNGKRTASLESANWNETRGTVALCFVNSGMRRCGTKVY